MTSLPQEAPQLVAAGHRLSGLAPALRVVTRLRWLLCLVGAGQSAAPIWAAGIQPVDMMHFSRAGGWILQGRLGEIYSTSWMQAGPFELLASWALYPFDRQHTTSYVRTGLAGQYPLRLIGGALIVAAVMFLVRYLRRLHDLPDSAPMELAAGLTAVLIAVPYQFWMGGHLAQFGIPLMWVAGTSLAVRGRSTAAGLVIGLSAGWEPWGVLLAGALLTERDPRRLVQACTAFTAGALLPYLPFLATGRFEMFHLLWAVRKPTLIGLLFPHMTTFSWELRLFQGIAAGLAGVVVALALGRRRDVIWIAPLTVVVVRLLLDPLILSYYWGPFLFAVVIGVGLLHPHCSPTRAVLASALAGVALVQFRYTFNREVPLLIVSLVLLVALVVTVRRDEPAGSRPVDA
ncbi:hypothetical protein GCM10022223_56640 [Kineosporia mesophila]|uniref:DUF2029 domain-containing protein n=1 Tax=Kineosporia mesophila TaxID=566012 RepID=A0ABP7AFX0_9ACTN|nr:hypothetical protein [Kineosporia mesophila]MCD5354407.1 hypothetical protein [Kineosporia mesophila]